jgi:hypothetical protein
MKKLLLVIFFVILPVFGDGAEITISIDNAKISEIIDGVAYQNGYKNTLLDEDNLPTIPNPVLKKDYVLELIRKYIRQCYKAWKVKENTDEARSEAIDEADDYTSGILIE